MTMPGYPQRQQPFDQLTTIDERVDFMHRQIEELQNSINAAMQSNQGNNGGNALPTIGSPGIGDLLADLDKLVAVTQNAGRIQIFNAQVTNTNVEVTVPVMTIPDGMTVIYESRWSNGGILNISPRGNVDKTKQYLPGQNVGFRVKDTSQVVVYGTAVGDYLDIFCELKI